MEIIWRIISRDRVGENRNKVQGIRSMIGGHKIDGGRLKIV